MLGKINEKIEEQPAVYLAHYHEVRVLAASSIFVIIFVRIFRLKRYPSAVCQASKLLDANGAEYPTRVVYSSPQYYSVEALEVGASSSSNTYYSINCLNPSTTYSLCHSIVIGMYSYFSFFPFFLSFFAYRFITECTHRYWKYWTLTRKKRWTNRLWTRLANI